MTKWNIEYGYALLLFTILFYLSGCTERQDMALKSTSKEQSTAIGEKEPKFPVLLQRPDSDTIKRLRALLPERGEAARVSLESKLNASNDTELTVLRSAVNPYGRTVTQLSLAYKGVPVEEAFWKVHTNEEGLISYTSKRVVDNTLLAQVDMNPTISQSDAETVALRYLGKNATVQMRNTSLLLAVQKERYVLPNAVGKETLNVADMAYRVKSYSLQYVVIIDESKSVTGFHSWAIRVDAHSGAFVAKADTVLRAGPPSPVAPAVTDAGVAIDPKLSRNGRSQYVRKVNVPSVSKTISGGEINWVLSDPSRGNGHAPSSYSGGNIVVNAKGKEPDTGATFFALIGSSDGNFTSTDNEWGFSDEDLEEGNLNFTDPGWASTNEEWNSRSAQTAAVDVMYNITLVYDMWKAVFNRRSYDDNDSSIVAFVHLKEWDKFSVNAYWHEYNQMFAIATPRLGRLQWTETDLVAHELGHGLFQFDVMGGTNALQLDQYHSGINSGEFGGISEANADIWGVLAEYYESEYSKSHVWSRYPTSIPDFGGDWHMGGKSGAPIRVLYYPDKRGQFIEMPDVTEGSNSPLAGKDPHDASGPISRMFYFLSMGAYKYHPLLVAWASTRVPAGFDGIGMTAAAKIWYKTIQDYTLPNDTFSDLRIDCLRATEELYGKFSPAYKAVEDAFAAVNIGDPALRTGPEVTLNVPIPHVYPAGTLTIPVDFAHPELYDIRKLTYVLQGEDKNGHPYTETSYAYEPEGMDPANPLVLLTSLPSPVNLEFPKSDIAGFSLKLTVEVEDEYKNVTKAEARVDVRKPLFEVASKNLRKPRVTYSSSTEKAHFRADPWDESAVSHADFYQLSSGVKTTDSVPSDYLSLSYICGSNLYKTVFGGQEPCETYNGYYFKSSIDTTFMAEGNYITQVVIHDMYGNSNTRYVPWAISRVEPTLTLDVTGTQVPTTGVRTFKGEITLRSQWTSAFTTGNYVRYQVDSNDVGSLEPTGVPPGTWYDKTLSTLNLDNGSHVFSAVGRDKFGHIVENSKSFNVYNEDNAPPPLPTKEVYNEPPENNNDYTSAPFVPLSTDQIRGKYHYTFNDPIGGRGDDDPYRFSVPAGKMVTFKTSYYCDPKIKYPSLLRHNGLLLATREERDNNSWNQIREFDGSQQNLSTWCSGPQSKEWILEAFFAGNGCKTTTSYKIDVEVSNCTSSTEMKFDQCIIAPDCSTGQQCIDGGCQDVAGEKIYSECSADSPCDIYEGDCNTDSQCSFNLACGDNNGPEFGYPNGVDLCIPKSCSDGFTNFSETGLDCGGLCGPCISNPVGDPRLLFRSKFMQ